MSAKEGLGGYLEGDLGHGREVLKATVSDVVAGGGGNVANQTLREEATNAVGATHSQDVDVLQQVTQQSESS